MTSQTQQEEGGNAEGGEEEKPKEEEAKEEEAGGAVEGEGEEKLAVAPAETEGSNIVQSSFTFILFSYLFVFNLSPVHQHRVHSVFCHKRRGVCNKRVEEKMGVR